MHFAFILRCRCQDGKIWHMPWQIQSSTRKEAAKRVARGFERDNIYAPGSKKSCCASLEEIIEAGECEDGVANVEKLYDATCAKAMKLDAKANSPKPPQG